MNALLRTLLLLILYIVMAALISCKNNPAELCTDCPVPIDPVVLNDTAWTQIGLGEETISALAIDPTDSRIIYAGGGRVFRTTNGGAKWDTLGFGGSYHEIIVDPINPQTIYAMPGGIIKSENGGNTWQNKNNGITLDFEHRVISLELDYQTPNVLYAGTGGPFGGDLYKTTNAGENWFSIATNDSLRDSNVSIAIDRSNHETIYVATSVGLVFKSTNSGVDWNTTGLERTSGFIYDICIDPGNSNRVLIGLNWQTGASKHGVWKSEDGGSTWQGFNEGFSDSVSVLNILKQPNSSTIYVVVAQPNRSGVYKRSEVGGFWERVGTDVAVSTYSDLQMSSDGMALYLGGYQGILGIQP